MNNSTLVMRREILKIFMVMAAVLLSCTNPLAGAISWKINDGVLTISGTGDMPDYHGNREAPWKNSGFSKVVIEEGVTSIGANAFGFGACKLTSITIPNSVTNIGDNAFDNCYKLTDITIPSSVTKIGMGVFMNCPFKSITIPNSMTSIGDGAFSCCYDLTSITIPISVTSIGSSAFYRCI